MMMKTHEPISSAHIHILIRAHAKRCYLYGGEQAREFRSDCHLGMCEMQRKPIRERHQNKQREHEIIVMSTIALQMKIAIA